jgi:hypothetical protein
MLRLHYCAVVISAFVLVVTNCAAQTPATKSGSRGLPTDYGFDPQSALLIDVLKQNRKFLVLCHFLTFIDLFTLFNFAVTWHSIASGVCDQVICCYFLMILSLCKLHCVTLGFDLHIKIHNKIMQFWPCAAYIGGF